MRYILIFLLLCGVIVSTHAQSAFPPLTHAQEALIRKIEGRLMAPCCYTQTIRDHDSQVAVDMRNEVTSFVASGKSEQEIITYYRTKYVETILVVPDGWTGHLLTFLPVSAFLLSAAALLISIRKSVGSTDKLLAQVAPAEIEVVRPDLRQRIRDELGEF